MFLYYGKNQESKVISNIIGYGRMILLGFYTSDPYDDEGVPILRITDIQDDHSRELTSV